MESEDISAIKEFVQSVEDSLLFITMMVIAEGWGVVRCHIKHYRWTSLLCKWKYTRTSIGRSLLWVITSFGRHSFGGHSFGQSLLWTVTLWAVTPTGDYSFGLSLLLAFTSVSKTVLFTIEFFTLTICVIGTFVFEMYFNAVCEK